VRHAWWYAERMTVQLAVRIENDQIEAIDRLVPELHQSRSELIRRAIELYLYKVASEKDAAIYASQPLTNAELSLGAAVENWSAAPQW
jgi:Arc/MetJ-type ribon-helix-helix transcriptional regulator